MAASLNKVLLIGNLTADPELSYTPEGTAKAVMRLATNETWTGKDGKKGSRTEWHRLIAWGRLAEVCGEYLVKGRQIFGEGRIQTRSWEDKDGVKRWTTEIVVTNMQMLGSRKDQAEPEQVEPNAEEEDEELPF
jgi:single-strand DNA-binding protein